ncbi:hypothetical protein I552_3338 [Mycobacterium xenopi 3993]|nr:hypothetical protein I552_3338 [Mycobacterium xenopi 3993]
MSGLVAAEFTASAEPEPGRPADERPGERWEWCVHALSLLHGQRPTRHRGLTIYRNLSRCNGSASARFTGRGRPGSTRR